MRVPPIKIMLEGAYIQLPNLFVDLGFSVCTECGVLLLGEYEVLLRDRSGDASAISQLSDQLISYPLDYVFNPDWHAYALEIDSSKEHSDIAEIFFYLCGREYFCPGDFIWLEFLESEYYTPSPADPEISIDDDGIVCVDGIALRTIER